MPDPSARWLDCLAMLVRHRLTGADGDRHSEAEKPPHGSPEHWPATPCWPPATPSRPVRHTWPTWPWNPDGPAPGGLGRALAASDTHPIAAQLLSHHPERARAVHEALLRVTGTPPDPVHLATWLGSPPSEAH
ncbi:hypothetical protein [Streptomyces sp. F001]|uniref:hypothetical protein n=1 Tax=Streptomyces sp. F001 TaxID=1510026 RepID=UPI00101E822A|nr:hypothetical protein [Streptomyces sp. F001]